MPRKPQPPPEEIEENRRALGHVNEVLAGRLRVRLEGGSSKLLYMMVRSPKGCDAILSSDGFQVRFGEDPGQVRFGRDPEPHWYLVHLVPACISQFLVWAKTEAIEHDVLRARLPAAGVPDIDFMPWSFSARQLWLRREKERVLLAIRAGEDPPSLPWPAPFPFRQPAPPEWRLYDPPAVCPHCQRPVERARDLGGALVCPHCARSFEAP